MKPYLNTLIKQMNGDSLQKPESTFTLKQAQDILVCYIIDIETVVKDHFHFVFCCELQYSEEIGEEPETRTDATVWLL